MTRFTAALLILTLAGCAGSTIKRDVSRGFHWQGIEVSGEVQRNYVSDGWTTEKSVSLIVTANGSPIISGPLDPRNYNGIVSGSHGGKPAAAVCTSKRITDTFTDVTCDISFDGQRAGMLRF